MSYLNYGVERTSYFYSAFDNLLESDNYVLQGSNIGDQGENLTITFLSLNRSVLSEKLLNSIHKWIPEFKGHILIIDNGSEAQELEKLNKICESLPFNYSIVKLERNFGVAGGRNRTMEYVNTDWVLCLDNDIYFTYNPISTIRNEISLLGCHFMNLPLLDSDEKHIFALGGHLYVESNQGVINVGGGSCYKQLNYDDFSLKVDKPFLSNFLFGGASLLKKETYVKLGGFDEGLFIGFEDIDFSIRLFREGYKIGNSAAVCLVHNHPKPENNVDMDYEKKRFSVNTIEKSAKYLENKYGYKIWDNNLIKWLEEKHALMGNSIDIQLISDSIEQKKPKIALITDVDYWAFGNIARQIEKNLRNNYDIILVSYKDCNWDPVKLLFRTADCDVLHFFWREMIPHFTEHLSEHSFFSETKTSPTEFLEEHFYNKVLSTSVYDHLFLSQMEIEQRNSLFNTFNYYVCSNKLDEVYKLISEYPNPLMVIEDGVDDTLFYPGNIDRFDDYSRSLVIGWVGNSEWAAHTGEDFKGFRTIVKPAVEDLIDRGYSLSAKYCDRKDGFVSHEDMVKYYSQIDVLVCMSKIEGTPNPVLEAMACGVPIITTDVGIVQQVLGPIQKEYVVEESSIQTLQEKIIQLDRNKYLLKKMSNENLEYISPWFWKEQCRKYKTYFDLLIEKAQ